MKKRKYSGLLITFLIVIVTLFTILTQCAKKYFFPRGADVLHSYAENDMFEIMNNVTRRVIEEYSIDYSKLADIKYTADGKISSVNINYLLVNKIKSEISTRISKELTDCDDNDVYIPVGDFSNNIYFIGKGPKLHFKLVQRGCIQTDFEQNFESAGINSVMHTLKIKINADVALLLPFYDTHTIMNTNVILAQTVINGDCPEQIFKLNRGENSND